MENVTRRGFVGAAGAAACATAGLATAGRASAEEAAWDVEAEIVVCGFGGAGAIAAIDAHDAGAQVLILEKLQDDEDGTMHHTNATRLSSSVFMRFNDKQGAVDYLTACSRGATPSDVIESWAGYATGTADYFTSLGAEEIVDSGATSCEYSEELLPEGQNYTQCMFSSRGEGMWQLLKGCVADREIEVRYETPMKSLVTNADGDVVGVVADSPSGEIRVHATKAVILATGGFEYNDDMLNQYIWAYPTRYYTNPGNTGDGIRAAQAVGANLWHMTLVGGRLIAYFPELGYGIGGFAPSPHIVVDKYGKRFMNENWKSHSACWEAFRFSTDLCDFPAVPAYFILDDDAIKSGPVVMGSMLSTGWYTWSDDNSAEVEKGWILKADTLEELADVISSDPEINGKMKGEVLAATVEQYNAYCADGADPDFGRPAGDLVELKTGPFYAVKLYPGGVNTLGGPRRNAKGQIVRPDGSVIGGLYGAGEMGSVLGFLYAGGGWNITEIVTSGRLAAKYAAQEAGRA